MYQLLMGVFTFHYVSISTPVNRMPDPQLPHLHSTMYLFQHSPDFKDVLIDNLFTFHYVSISTMILLLSLGG